MIARRMTRRQFNAVTHGTPTPARAGKKPAPPDPVVYPPGTAAATVATGRNKACPCGSGKKYKACCRPHHAAG